MNQQIKFRAKGENCLMSEYHKNNYVIEGKVKKSMKTNYELITRNY